MRTGSRYWWLLLLTVLLQVSNTLGASIIPCDQVHASARISRANSLEAVITEQKKAPTGYVPEVVAAFRAFELQPRRRALAVALLRKIPSDRTQHEIILALDSAICDDESDAEMEALARVQNNFPRMLARAVELAPDYMEACVNYALIALNPHSDYAIQMQRVCRNRHQELTKAIAALPERDRKWFIRDVLDPKRCRAIAIPEAE